MIALPNKTSELVEDTLESKLFCSLGVAERIHTDRGTQFGFLLFMQLCDVSGVAKSDVEWDL